MSRGDSTSIEKLPQRLKLFFVLVIILLLFGTLGFIYLKGVTTSVAFVLTLETLAFMFHEGDSALKMLEIFLAIFGVFLIWWVLWGTFDMLLGIEVENYVRNILFKKKAKKMKNHYIIAGGGRVGEEIAKRIAKKKKEYIIIEKDEEKVNKLKSNNMPVLCGNATDKSLLIDANTSNAKAIILTLPETEVNLLTIMLAKELNPKIQIYARADNIEYMNVLEDAGAKFVVVPELAAVEKIMGELD